MSRTFHARRRFAATPSGDIAYVEQGQGPVALFIHGVPLNGFHWRNVMAELQSSRRCIALDLMGLGYTRIGPAHDVSFEAQARMVREFLDAMGIDHVDLIGNDSGGAIAQIFAANHPHRLRTLDAHQLRHARQLAARVDQALDPRRAQRHAHRALRAPDGRDRGAATSASRARTPIRAC